MHQGLGALARLLPQAPGVNLGAHLSYLEAEFAAALAAPLSSRKAMLVAQLIDAYADRLFGAQDETDDILVFRDLLAARSVELAKVFALCRGEARLSIEAMEVPLAEYGKLEVEDFMVSLYNQYTVQRVFIVSPSGERELVHGVLMEAVAVVRAYALPAG
jgi:hypothetical protein